MFAELLHIFILISIFFLIIHRYIKEKNLNLKQLIMGVLFSIIVVAISSFSLNPQFWYKKINMLIYLVIWVLPSVSFIITGRAKAEMFRNKTNPYLLIFLRISRGDFIIFLPIIFP
jgi:uncharacterized membrane protein YfcA